MSITASIETLLTSLILKSTLQNFSIIPLYSQQYIELINYSVE